MTDDRKTELEQDDGDRQPILLLPGMVSLLIGLFVAVHVARSLVLKESTDLNLVLWFGFLPIRLVAPDAFSGGLLPLLWTPVTHAFLHAGWEHLIFNTAWFAIFATPVARRYGALPMLATFLLGAAAGAIAFAATTLPHFGLLVGASGGVAALTGAAVRFIFQPVVFARHPETGEPVPVGRRLASLAEIFRNPRARWFTLIWIVINAAVPLLPLGGMTIAWQAHLGGFAFGLLIVPLFERRPRETAS